MARNTGATSRSAGRTTRISTTPDALELLKSDHTGVSALFKQFEKLKRDENADGMQEVVAEICKALSIHAQIEEEIFYPALREATDDTDSLDEADVEHSHVKEIVAQLEAAAPGDDLFEARVKVLSEYVEHHVSEEEGTLFAQARKADLDLKALGGQMAARKEELDDSAAQAEPDAGALLEPKRSASARNGKRASE